MFLKFDNLRSNIKINNWRCAWVGEGDQIVCCDDMLKVT